MNLENVLMALAAERPVFHSEADFQLALGWRLHNTLPEAKVRLEYKPFQGERAYVDIWVQGPAGSFALELKYRTRKLVVRVEDEVFELTDQGAQDIARYDFIKDLTRLERIVLNKPGVVGFAVLLTNDPLMWKAPSRMDTFDAAFRLYEGRVITGTLAWAPQVASGTSEGREQLLNLVGTYRLQWRDYSMPSRLDPYSRFRYLLIRVDPGLAGVRGGGEAGR